VKALGLEPRTYGLKGVTEQDACRDDAITSDGMTAAVAERLPDDPDLARLVEAWPTLSRHVRAAIVALVKVG
jgi:hypothetical protein